MAWYVVNDLTKLLACSPHVFHMLTCVTATQPLLGVKEETERKIRGARKPVWYVARTVAAAIARLVATNTHLFFSPLASFFPGSCWRTCPMWARPPKSQITPHLHRNDPTNEQESYK